MSLTLTAAAAERVRKVLTAANIPAVRVGVKPSGCSGYSYTIGPATDAHPDDVSFEDQGVRVVVREQHLPMLAGTRLDWRKDGLNEAFRFENPNAKESCGCGESFSV